MSEENEMVELQKKFAKAILSNNRKLAYKIMAKMSEIIKPEGGIDLCRIKAITHVYASNIYGIEWE